MSHQRQQRVFELLDEALERSPEDRRAFLDEACGDDPELRQEVEDLLETESESGFLTEPAFDVHAEDASIGRSIEHYRLVELLDRGGMGSVYLAEREDFVQRVALKLIRRGLDVDDVFVRRFHNERQILARLEHPHIARLLDGGTTVDRLPYFVMEYVEGEPIDRYCQTHELSIEERLELFRKVCAAVQFAHQNLVVHRDLKPGNILVSADGEPKLLDFGIAKLLDDDLADQTVATLEGQGLMTPRYASPEQIRREPITTASDVYSLGVLLYELLTGLDPYGVDTTRSDEIARAVCDKEPDRPSTAVRRRSAETETASTALEPGKLRSRLTGDLDSVVLKAMRKEPEQRYGSVERLSEDIHRHLAGLPVAARTGTFRYRAGKFVRRHWLAMVVVAAFLLLLLASSTAVTVFWQRAVGALKLAEIQKQEAETERQKAKDALDFVVDLFREADPNRTKIRDLTALELLERGWESAFDQLETKPELLIEVSGVLGDVFRNLGDYEAAAELMKLSLDTARERYEDNDSEVAKRLNNLAVFELTRYRFTEAEEYLREALIIRRQLGQEGADLFKVKTNLASALTSLGEHEEAERLYREVLDARIELHVPRFGEHDQNVATSRHHLGAFYFNTGNLKEAETELQQALTARQQAEERRPTSEASILDLLGSVAAARGEPDQAEKLYNKALSIRLDRLGEDHAAVASTRKNLAALFAARDPRRAREYLKEASRILSQTHPDGWEVAETMSIQGLILMAEGYPTKAEPLLVDGYQLLKKRRSERSFRTCTALQRIIDNYKTWGERPEELAHYRGIAESTCQGP